VEVNLLAQLMIDGNVASYGLDGSAMLVVVYRHPSQNQFQQQLQPCLQKKERITAIEKLLQFAKTNIIVIH
jgi:hypothetical protein